ncbi:methionyl-tRNA formyltransferase [Comamonas serinivorans]|uniref:Methionyl-tRNA formyltransferase n=1 Tax=Comamonas serinivorans TaxID=1082851 RepID=A0A1Y0ESN9_9BURK|nr:methionyl-tRNA formyltransferase [Comamonas serinivorans]ARU06391.1 methionyl-tRNA formyltransferase [Comamonas serinivorans]
MRLIFAGTPEFARVALAQLHAQGHDIGLVLTQPDRPAGRGLKLQPSPVKQFALAHDLPVAQPRSLRLDGKYPEDAQAAQAQILAAQADAMIVAAYGLILPQWVLDAMRGHGLRLGCLNIHASLLPRWRGAAPIHRAIEAGDARTGVTIMQMDAGLDTGDMLRVGETEIAADDTTGSLHDRLAEQGGTLMAQVLQAAADGQAPAAVPQPAEGITYAHKIDKAEAQVDWQQPAAVIARRVRAFDPFPGAATTLTQDGKSEAIKLWQAQVVPADEPAATGVQPGDILRADAQGIVVACGPRAEERLVLTQLQRAGGKRLGAGDFLRGFALVPGQRLG